jgi:hypothetical protein
MNSTAVAERSEATQDQRLPRIDYAAHPAYGGMFKPEKRLAAEARARLAPIIEDVERAERERAAVFGYRYGTPTDVTRELAADGCSVRRLDPELLEPLHQAARPLIETIRAQLAGLRAAGEPISFKATQELVAPDRHPELWKLAGQTMRKAGVVQCSTDYFGSGDAKLKAAAVMVNQPGQAWCNDIFRDGAAETPPTVGFHIDSSGYCTLKVVLYLNDVGPDQGPFGVIPTSHLWEQGGLDRVRRRAFDRSPLVSRSPGQRKAFLSLPPELQVKAEFGGDMPAGAPETNAFLARERVMTGPRGQLNLFDPEVIHRGGHARQGERHVFLLSVAARSWPIAAGQAGDAG